MAQNSGKIASIGFTLQQRREPSRLSSAFAILSHAFMTGCVAGLLYVGFSDVGIKILPERRCISPDLEYIIKTEKDSKTDCNRIILEPTREGDKAAEISAFFLGEGLLDSLSAGGNYLSIWCPKESAKSDRKIRVVQRSGRLVLPPVKAEEFAMSRDEALIGIMDNNEFIAKTFPQVKEVARIKNPYRFSEFRSKIFEFSPDGARAVYRTDWPDDPIAIFDIKSRSLIDTAYLTGRSILVAKWIDGHGLIVQAKKGGIEELFLIDNSSRVLQKLGEGESLLLASPFGRVYSTRETHRLDKKNYQSDSGLLRFYEKGGRLLFSRVLPNVNILISQVSHDGRIAIQGLEVDRRGIPHDSDLMIFNPPDYNLERRIERARCLFFTPGGTIAYWSSDNSISGQPTALANTDLQTGNTEYISYHDTVERGVRNRLGWMSLFTTPLILMGGWGLYIERRRRRLTTESEKDYRVCWRDLLSNPLSVAAMAGGAFFTGVACKFFSDHDISKVSSFLGDASKLVGPLWAANMSMIFGMSFASFYLAMSDLRRDLRWDKKVKEAVKIGADVGSDVEILPIISCYSKADVQLRLAGEYADLEDYSQARIGLYRAVESPREFEPSGFSYFHAIVGPIKRAMNYLEAVYRCSKRGDRHKVFMMEWYQAWLVTNNHPKRAISWTDAILDAAGDNRDEIQLHQARVHTALGSARSFELWQDPLTSIISSIEDQEFTSVHGGTSEVLKVPKEKSPYAERTVILKRNIDEQVLLRECEVTAEISAATGGVNGTSSLPLTFVSKERIAQARRENQYSCLALLFLDGITLQERSKGMSKREIEHYLKEQAMPRIAQHHRLLEENIDLRQTNLQTMDYLRIFTEKFVKRATKDPKRQAELIEAGRSLAYYLDSLKRTPIHGDLHASNIITPSLTLIDHADATFAHASLDLAHLLHDPALKLDPQAIALMMDHYRQARGHDPQTYRPQDCAGTAHRLCHLVGRDVAYNRPDEMPHHCRGLMWTLAALTEMGIKGIDNKTIRPIEDIAREME